MAKRHKSPLSSTLTDALQRVSVPDLIWILGMHLMHTSAAIQDNKPTAAKIGTHNLIAVIRELRRKEIDLDLLVTEWGDSRCPFRNDPGHP